MGRSSPHLRRGPWGPALSSSPPLDLPRGTGASRRPPARARRREAEVRCGSDAHALVAAIPWAGGGGAGGCGPGRPAAPVSVAAAAPLVEALTPSVGATIPSEQIDALPLEGRSAVSLITLTGAATDAGNSSSRSMTSSRGIAISGGQPFGVAYLLDGALHNNAFEVFNLLRHREKAVRTRRAQRATLIIEHHVVASLQPGERTEKVAMFRPPAAVQYDDSISARPILLHEQATPIWRREIPLRLGLSELSVHEARGYRERDGNEQETKDA